MQPKGGRCGRVGLGAAIALGLAPLSAGAWVGVVDRPFDVGGSRVAHASGGDVVVAGRTDLSGDQGRLSVAKFSRSGRLRWQTTISDVLTADPRSLAVDRTGHVYVAGAVGGDDEDTFGPFTVIKFDAADGREAWRWHPNDQEGLAGQVAVDDRGDAFVAGYYLRPFEADSMAVGVVAKLAGASGGPLWVVEEPWADARAVATLPGGDVVTIEGGDVRRRSGNTGSPVWQSSGAGGSARQVEVDRRGDVIVAQSTGVLRKLDGHDGKLRWETSLRGFEEPVSTLADVAVDPAGDVVVSGSVRGVDWRDFAVMKVDGTSGAERWRYVVEGKGEGRAVAVAVDARGDAFVTGQLVGYPSRARFEVLEIEGKTGRVAWSHERSEIGGGADVAVDPAGHVAVSGFLVFEDPSRGEDSNLVVVRLSSRGAGPTGSAR